MTRYRLGLFIAVGAGYALGSQVAFSWFGADGVSASFFPAAGVTLAALVLTRRREWPIVLAAAGLAELTLDLLHGIDPGPTVGYVVANLVQPVVGAVLLRSLFGSPNLGRTRDLAGFIACAVVTGPAVGGMLGASAFVVLDDGTGWARFTAQWWVGDGLGVLVVGGAILALRARAVRPVSAPRLGEAALLLTASVLGTIAVFWFDHPAIAYVPIALLLGTAFRVGTAGVAVVGASTAFVAAEATAEGHTFWEALDVAPSTGLLYLQLALALIIASAFLLASEIAQRERAALAWAESEGARRESNRARERADRLRRLAQDLGRASTAAEISGSLAAHGFDPPPEQRRSSGLPESPALASDELLQKAAAAQMAEEAYRRVSLYEAERQALAREREARVRAELLERNAAHLAAAATVRDVAESTVADLEAAGIAISAVDLVQDETVEILATRGLPSEMVEPARSYPLAADSPGAEAIRTGKTIEIATGEEYDVRYPDSAANRRRMGVETVMSVPLRASDGRVIGALLATASKAHWLDDTRRQLLTGVARQCGLALERAMLQAEAEAAARDAAFLVHLSDSLDAATTVTERASGLVELLTAERYAFAAVHRVEAQEAPTLVASRGTAQDRRAGVDPLAERVSQAVATAEVVVAHGDGGSPLVTILPLQARGHVLGALTIDGPDSSIAREIATRAAIALDNALLYEREREVSHSLQLGLLGGALPAVDGLAIASAYRPATATLEVGGDWYDAFVLPTGSLALVVGDVVGHGLEAAVAMGQLRGAVRALAPTGTPAQVVERLNSFAETLPGAGMTTLAYVEFEPSTRGVRYACAGHPPPLVVTENDGARFLWEGRSLPLGSALEKPRGDATDRLGDGETLVLYTDGLVERRGESLEVGLQRFAAAVQGGSRDAADLVEHICDTVLDRQAQEDDVCVLALVPLSKGTMFVHSFPAAPAELAGLRQRLAAWLQKADVDSEVQQTAVVAVSEAAANAVEHAYGFDGSGVVSVVARLDQEGDLHVTIRDEGRWREPSGDTGRGRGTTIMQSLMSEVSIEREGGATVVRMRKPARERTTA